MAGEQPPCTDDKLSCALISVGFYDTWPAWCNPGQCSQSFQHPTSTGQDSGPQFLNEESESQGQADCRKRCDKGLDGQDQQRTVLESWSLLCSTLLGC